MRIGTAIASALIAGSAWAQRSPFNGLEIGGPDSTGHYRILIGGHFHGASTSLSGFPAATLLANIDTINTLGAALFISTGDLFLDAKNDPVRYGRTLFRRLKVPLFNAIGNHDLYRGEVTVGPRTWSCTIAGDRFIILDTEKDAGSIGEDQLGLLKTLADDAAAHRAFIVSHRPIWAEEDPQYGPLFAGNTRSALGINFKSEVYPLVQRIAEHAEVYWISGSLGGQARSSIFFQPHAKNITFIQCAIRDEPRDALLIADLSPDAVKWSSFSLTGHEVKAPEVYDAAWWRGNIGASQGFNWRLLPYKLKMLVMDRAFWAGGILVALVALMIARFRRRRPA